MKFVRLLCVLLLLLPSLATGGESLPVPESSGAVSGLVQSDSGDPVAGVLVEAWSCDDDVLAGTALSGAQGEYHLGPLPKGCYKLRFTKKGYESSWYEDLQNVWDEGPTEVEVSGATVPGIDAPLTPADTLIQGQLMNAAGEPLADGWVQAVRVGEQGYNLSDGHTGADGRYAIEVTAGDHIVLFSHRGYVSQIFGGRVRDPEMVAVSTGVPATGIDASLDRGGAIAGVVVDSSGQGIAGIMVMALGENMIPVRRRTNAQGHFALDGLGSGDYRVFIGDPKRHYQSLWYGGGINPIDAKAVAVNAPATTGGLRVVLQAAGGISGWVTDELGNGLAQVQVLAVTLEGNPVARAMSEDSGAFTLGGLPAGNYNLSFQGSQDYLAMWYPDTTDAASAQPVAIKASQVTEGVSQVLTRALSLHGMVVNESGEPVPWVSVTVHAVEQGKKKIAGFGFTDADGRYVVPLPAGEYLAEFDPVGRYLEQWSGGGASRDAAEKVEITTERGVEMDITLLCGATIAGIVRDRAGEPVAGIQVRAVDAASGNWRGNAETGEDGRYAVDGLASGSYRLIAIGNAQGYIREQLPHTFEAEAPATSEGADFVLTKGGAVSGRVVNQEGTPLEGVEVTAFDPFIWKEIASVDTGEDGSYYLGGLPQKTYCLRYEKSGYVVQWSDGRYRREEAQPVLVAGVSTYSGYDAVLSRGVSLAGSVADSSGTPLAEAKVEAYGEMDDEPFATARTGRDGQFVLDNLAPGNYRLRFSHEQYIPRWYGGQDRLSATPFPVVSEAAPALHMTLLTGVGRIAGKLLSPAGEDVGQAWFSVIDVESGVVAADERICECSGRFNTPLPAGNYRLRVERYGKTFWYGGESADTAQVFPGPGDVSGLKMVIEPGM